MRNTVVMVVLAILAAATWVATWQRQDAEPAGGPQSRMPTPLGYYVRGARIARHRRARPRRRTASSPSGSTSCPAKSACSSTGVNVEYQPGGRDSRGRSPRRARAYSKDGSKLELVGDVELRSVPDGRLGAADDHHRRACCFRPDTSSAEADASRARSVSGIGNSTRMGLRTDLKGRHSGARIPSTWHASLLSNPAPLRARAGVALRRRRPKAAATTKSSVLESRSLSPSTGRPTCSRAVAADHARRSARSRPTTRSPPASSSTRRASGVSRATCASRSTRPCMEADSAVFTFADRNVRRAASSRARRRLVQRRRRSDGKKPSRARASKMSYDYVARTLRMTGDASVAARQTSRSRAAISSTTSDAERVTSGSADCEGGFRVTGCRDPDSETTAPDAPMSRLEALGVAKRYRMRQVVKDLSLSIESGEVVGLLGPNGAGKTTAFYMIVGLVRCDQGRIHLARPRRHEAARAPARQARPRLSAAGSVGVSEVERRGQYPRYP